MPCKFSAPNKQACPAYEDQRSPRGFCFAHEEIYLHDCALAFRKKQRRDQGAAERWAIDLGLPVERLKVIADDLPLYEQPIALVIS